jgi:hypothetical protein
MKRSLAILAALSMTALTGFVASPPAEAVAIGACAISGTITFTPSANSTDHGAWIIGPAVISCRGPFRFPHPEQMSGEAGSFSGIGSYTAVPSGEGHCLRELGNGTVDYWVKTEEQDVHMKEPHAFLLAGAGLFTTPTLRGTFQVPLYEGNCLTAPVSRAMFLAQVTLVRVPRSPEYLGPD